MDIDLDIEKQIAQLQESKMQENIKKVVPEDFDTQLGTFYSTIQEEKKDLKEKVKHDEDKIKQFEKLFSKLTTKKEPVKEKKIETKVEVKKEPKKIEANAIKTQEIESASNLLEYLLPKEVPEYNENIIDKVSKQISEMQVATELDKDRIKKLEELDTLGKLKKEFLSFRDTVSKQMGTIGGGGETQLKFLDDVDTASALVDKRVLQYDGATGKFIGTTLETEDLVLNGTDASGSNAGDRLVMDGTDSSSSNAGDGVDLQDGTFGAPALDLSSVDQDIIPDTTNSRNLGSATNRWNDLFLAGDTIDLAGATISSDGTGSISIAATGATLPAGSKAGTNPIAIVSSSGETLQPATLVPFFTASEGLNTKNTDFEFNSSIDTRMTFTGTKTFTLASGNLLTDSDTTIFQF
jgi:hypothetical protein